jgi:small subunit ribosomal protein S17
MSGRRKSMVGKVISNKMDKTVVVEVERLRRHPLYKKVIKLRSRFKAHDAANACQIGDVVRIAETRPLSKEKRWVVEEIVRSTAERMVR